MWVLFHRNAKTRPVRDGHTFVEECPDCGKRATFVEVPPDRRDVSECPVLAGTP